jgi:translation elongation factor EF-4
MPTGLMLIGNKHDLDEMNEREVSTETGETFAKIYNAHFMETSAKTGFNVGNCLMNLVRTIKVYYEQDSSERRERGIQVANKPKGSGCCGR